MVGKPSGDYVSTAVAGEKIRAFVPEPLPPRLIAAGILSEVGERKRDRLYRYDRYLNLLDGSEGAGVTAEGR